MHSMHAEELTAQALHHPMMRSRLEAGAALNPSRCLKGPTKFQFDKGFIHTSSPMSCNAVGWIDSIAELLALAVM